MPDYKPSLSRYYRLSYSVVLCFYVFLHESSIYWIAAFPKVCSAYLKEKEVFWWSKIFWLHCILCLSSGETQSTLAFFKIWESWNKETCKCASLQFLNLSNNLPPPPFFKTTLVIILFDGEHCCRIGSSTRSGLWLRVSQHGPSGLHQAHPSFLLKMQTPGPLPSLLNLNIWGCHLGICILNKLPG